MSNLAEVYRRAANVMKTGPIATILKYQRGKWSVRGGAIGTVETNMTGKRLIALPLHAQLGWTKWDRRQPVDQVLGYYKDEYKPLAREQLGDTDEGLWDIGSNGRPKDPWALGSHLPFLDPETGELFVFSTTSRGGISAIGYLFNAYADHLTQEPNSIKMPVIELSTDGYNHREYNWVDIPQFDIVGWEEPAERHKLPAYSPPPPPRIAQPPTQPKAIEAPKSKSIHDEIDDEIPF
jgi:hypothetical protein